MPERPPAPAGGAPPAPPADPAPALGLKCPGCDGALDKARYCKKCDGQVDDEGDLVPVGLLGRVAALEGDADRSNKLTRIFENGFGLDLDALDAETFGPLDLVKAAKKKLSDDPKGQEALESELMDLIPEELRGLLG
jgi:hypothetical protein